MGGVIKKTVGLFFFFFSIIFTTRKKMLNEHLRKKKKAWSRVGKRVIMESTMDCRVVHRGFFFGGVFLLVGGLVFFTFFTVVVFFYGGVFKMVRGLFALWPTPPSLGRTHSC